MTPKSPDTMDLGSMFSSSEVAARWQSRKAQRDKVNAAVNEIMIDAAELRPGNRVLHVAAGTGDQTLRCP
jgi:ubiquinone/menaquinone biosynthesis C-methylase UbiE